LIDSDKTLNIADI